MMRTSDELHGEAAEQDSQLCNEHIEAAWASTGRLRRFYQCHVPLRWDQAIAEAQAHQLDPWVVLVRTSSRYKGNFDVQAAQSRHQTRLNMPECCCRAWRSTADDPLDKASNGHWTCGVHRYAAGSISACPHMSEWNAQFA